MRARVKYFLLLVPLVLVFAGCTAPVLHLPTPTGVVQSTEMSIESLSATPQPMLLEKRLLILEWPATVREKDSDLIVLTISMDEQGQLTATAQNSVGPASIPTGIPVEIPNIYATHNIVAVARLDLAGMEAYREEIREPLLPGQSVAFRWSIRAAEAGTYRGVVWLRLELVPKKGGPIEEMLLLARPIEIQAVTVLGLPGSLARIIGGVGLLVSSVLGYPFIQNWVAEFLKKRRQGKSQPAQNKTDSEEVHQREE